MNIVANDITRVDRLIEPNIARQPIMRHELNSSLLLKVQTIIASNDHPLIRVTQ